MDFAHYVGKAYYLQEGFIWEANRLGVSRKVPLKSINGIMEWGDTVYLLQGDMRTKRRVTPVIGSILFGSFQVARLSGLSQDGWEVLKDLGLVENEFHVGRFVHRGCGSYTINMAAQTYSSLKEITKALSSARSDGVDVGCTLIQGDLTLLEPNALLPEMTFRWGIYPFNGEAFRAVYNHAAPLNPNTGLKVVGGTFKIPPMPSTEKFQGTAEVQSLERYIQAEYYMTLAEQCAAIELLHSKKGSG